MRERIILAPGAKGSELVKSLAMHGINSFNLRICSAVELARMSLIRSGVAIPGDFVSRQEETALVAEAAMDVDYFKSASYSDMKDLAGAIRNMRCLVAERDEEERIADIMSRGEFTEKNAAIVSVYKNYMKLLKERKLTDSVSVVRKALSESVTMDADFLYLTEYPLNPLEKALIKRLSGGKACETCLAEMFRIDDTGVKIESFKDCYGASNETEAIIDEIYRTNAVDKCTVAVTDPLVYGQLFFDLALLYDIPITFSCGIPITNSNPAKLLGLYQRWMSGGFFSGYLLNTMLNSPFFNSAVINGLYPEKTDDFNRSTYENVLCGLRVTNDKNVNEKRLAYFKKAVADEEKFTDPSDEKAYKKFKEKKLCLPYLEVLVKELTLPVEEFISKYAYIRKGSETNAEKLLMILDLASVNAIKDEIRIMRAAGVRLSDDEMIQNALGLSVASCSSEEGKLFVTGIDGALNTVRENIYIAGLSASKYPGSPKEDHLLLDTDLALFGENGTGHITSSGRIVGKRERLLSLVRLSSGLGSRIYVSYSGLNVSELKKDNASSLIYELYREEHKGNVTPEELKEHIEKVNYFKPALSATRKVGEAYNDGKIIIPVRTEKRKTYVKWEPDREFSPTELDEYNTCKRKFMLKCLVGLQEPDDDMPFKVIAANEAGNIAHSLMKELGNSDMTLGEFLELSGKYFDKFLAEHTPLLEESAKAEREEFLEMMETAYNTDPHGEVVFGEEKVSCIHESGVGIQGYPDRIERSEDGNYLVVDFKTGRKINHVEDDIESCLQNVMYAYLMEQNGFKISGTEYRYIRLGETVSCKYDDQKKKELFVKLSDFKAHLESTDFPITDKAYEENRSDDDQDPCEYCDYGMICGKEDMTGGLGDE